MDLHELIKYLDSYLCIADVPDHEGARNGLQVAGQADVRKIAVAVDACRATIEMAATSGVNLMIVHHGLFWDATAPITGAYYERLAGLIKRDIGLYSCHLPLDAHPEVGNNHCLARMLGLEPDTTFGEFEGVPIGVVANANISRAEFVQRVRDTLHIDPLVIAAGPQAVRRVGVLTGGGGSWIDRAVAAGVDTYLTGEGEHHTYFDAEENGINVIYAGHYATETVGVQALGEHLRQRFGLDVVFLDHPTGL